MVEISGNKIPVSRDLTKLPGISIQAGRKKANVLIESENAGEEVSGPENEFSEERFTQVWMDYAAMIKAQGKDTFYLTLTKRKPVLVDGKIIVMRIDNKSQEQVIEREKQTMLEYIRKQLDHFGLVLEVNIEQGSDDTFLYTNKEKFKKMAEKNPNLLLLQKRLNLDIEY